MVEPLSAILEWRCIAPDCKDADVIHLYTDASAQLHYVPGPPPRSAELHRRCPVTQPHATLLFSYTPDTSVTNTTPPAASRALKDTYNFLLTKAQSHLQKPYSGSSHPGHSTLAGPSTPPARVAATHHCHPGTDAGLLDSDLPETHDRLMVKAALTLGFFGFLRVSEFTTKGRGTIDPKIHPTRRDITGSKDDLLFFIKKS
ncbi:hypothetical protein EMCRGX_G027306 [Ephydatia muelleri]